MLVRTDFLRAVGLVAAAAMVGALVGCAGSIARKPLVAPGVKLEQIARSQYKIMDTVEGKGQVRTLLCFIPLGDKQYGYSSGGGSSAGLVSLLRRPQRDAAAAATYDAIGKLTNADMFLPLTTTASYSGFGCIWKTERATVRGKAIRILSDR